MQIYIIFSFDQTYCAQFHIFYVLVAPQSTWRPQPPTLRQQKGQAEAYPYLPNIETPRLSLHHLLAVDHIDALRKVAEVVAVAELHTRQAVNALLGRCRRLLGDGEVVDARARVVVLLDAHVPMLEVVSAAIVVSLVAPLQILACVLR